MIAIQTLFLLFYSVIPLAEDTFNIHIFENRYSEQDLEYVKRNNVFDSYNLLSQGYLESNTRKGHIDLNKVKKSIISAYPDVNACSYLVLDFEGLIFQNLKNYDMGSEKFNEAETEFIEMINLVKKVRPMIKVGIYGIPFRFYYPDQYQSNKNHKTDILLSKCDFIAPSLYVLYSEKEKKTNENIHFIKSNLDISLGISKRINKPVIPFFWYMVNPVNTTYGYEVISKRCLSKYLDVIESHSFNGVKAKAIFWWDVSEKYFDYYINISTQGKRRKNRIKTKMDLFKYYQLEKNK